MKESSNKDRKDKREATIPGVIKCSIVIDMTC